MAKKTITKELASTSIGDIQKGVVEVATMVPLAATFKGNLAIIDAYEEGARKSLLWMSWNIGRICTEMAAQEGIYGSNVVDRVAEHIGKGKRIVFEMQKVYNTFHTEDDVTKLDAGGFGWTQVKLLSRVSDDKERAKIIDQVKRENLNSVELEALVKQRTAAPKEPETPVDKKPKGAFDLIKYAKTVDKTMTEIRAMLRDVMKELPTALEIMDGALDDVFHPAYAVTKKFPNDVDAILPILEEIRSFGSWDV